MSDSSTPPNAQAIAKQAYLYGFPLVTNYRTMYKQAIDKADKDYKAPLNVLANSPEVATPEDKFVVTPNSDTPYSYVWMDLRAEPVVITMPEIEKDRYYTGQLIDLYTFNFAYLGTRSFGNGGGLFMVAGPNWRGETPQKVKAVLKAETDFAYLLIRTQLFNREDLGNVHRIQAGFRAQPLSGFLDQPPPTSAATIEWPKPTEKMFNSPELFRYLNFLLQFCPENPSERTLLGQFATIGVVAGKEFDFTKLSPELQKAFNEGIADARKDMDALMKRVNAEEVSSSDFFGTRASLKNNYLYRYAGAKLGLYGNSGEEAIYFGYFVDAAGKPLDASKNNYALRFAKGQLPPANAFWSITVYDGKTQFLVANPLNRYLLNSTMTKSFSFGSDDSLTLYLQREMPGKEREANWLPTPDGSFYAVLRIYMPSASVVNGTWKRPLLQAQFRRAELNDIAS